MKITVLKIVLINNNETYSNIEFRIYKKTNKKKNI